MFVYVCCGKSNFMVVYNFKVSYCSLPIINHLKITVKELFHVIKNVSIKNLFKFGVLSLSHSVSNVCNLLFLNKSVCHTYILFFRLTIHFLCIYSFIWCICISKVYLPASEWKSMFMFILIIDESQGWRSGSGSGLWKSRIWIRCEHQDSESL